MSSTLSQRGCGLNGFYLLSVKEGVTFADFICVREGVALMVLCTLKEGVALMDLGVALVDFFLLLVKGVRIAQ